MLNRNARPLRQRLQCAQPPLRQRLPHTFPRRPRPGWRPALLASS